MAQKSGFFNSSGGDRVYNADDFASYFGKLVTNGVFTSASDNLKVLPHTGMSVLARPGSAWINGYSYENTADLELTLNTANGVNPRIDRVVVRLSMIERSITLAVLTGVPAVTPTAPALTRTGDVYELCLADITIGKGVVTINAGDITDTRLNTSLCGTVNSLIGAVYE